MNTTCALMYKGEDTPIIINLGTDVFADLPEVIVGIVINKVLKKTWKKTETDPEIQVLPVVDEPNQCQVLVFRDDSNAWDAGLIVLEITLVFTDVNFPDGRHDMEVFNIGELVPSLTGNPAP